MQHIEVKKTEADNKGEEEFKLAQQYFADNNFEEALRSYAQAARQNHPEANLLTGHMIEVWDTLGGSSGPGRACLLKDPFPWYAQAAFLGNKTAKERIKIHALYTAKMLETIESKESHPNFCIDSALIEKTQKVGKGSYGRVFKAEWFPLFSKYTEKMTVAVKEPRHFNHDCLENLANELRFFFKNFTHPNIVRCYGASDNYTMIVEEYLAGGTLSDFLAKNPQATWAERHRLALGCAKAVAFLHKNYVIHHDIKSSNFLLDDKGEPKLCDFGQMSLLKEDKEPPNWGTYDHMPPEKFNGGPITPAADIFSLGVTLWEIGTGEKVDHCCTEDFKKPDGQLEDIRKSKFPDELKEGKRPTVLAISKNYPVGYGVLFQQCWATDQRERPGADTVVETLETLAPVSNLLAEAMQKRP